MVEKEQKDYTPTFLMWAAFVLSIGSLYFGYTEASVGNNAVPFILGCIVFMLYAIFFAVVRLK